MEVGAGFFFDGADLGGARGVRGMLWILRGGGDDE